ncbi:MAG TPA: LysR family transcriptional regulator [Burkholderiales bacterium]|nr:LysR family transcriptional regulator [Burkholderiales bacterium]
MALFKDLDGLIGRRLRLRDLRVFMAVVEARSMAKAASNLGVSQPAVSEIVASLEHALRVRLFDRKPQGVELTSYGEALLRRSRSAFDEFKQGLREIEGLADPTAGEVRVGCPESIAASVLPPILERFGKLYPRTIVHVEHVTTPTLELPQLHERRVDVAIVRMPRDSKISLENLQVQTLFDDHLVIAACAKSRWAQRGRIDLAELIDAPWILTPDYAWNTAILAEALAARSLPMPKIAVVTYSVQLRTRLLADGNYVTTFPNSVLRFGDPRLGLKELRVDIPLKPWPVVVVTLKNRTLSPVVQRFIEQATLATRAIT